MEKLDGMSMNLEQTNMDKLHTVFPECFVEGKLDIDKLLSLCGEYIDNDSEKYRFEWKGKSECLRLAQKRSTGTLRPCSEESVNWDTTKNLYIEGDNLEVLKLLQTSYYRKVKMIYIDPPYNTGNDFVYADDFADPMARYKEVTQQTTKSNPETMGRFHTNWLNMMYPRLRLAANLLRDDGVIFISIDDNEVTNLRKICDEVFGEENFVAQITLLCNPKGRSQDMYIANCHEYVLIYSKTVMPKGSLSIPKSAEDIAADYTLKDEMGSYRELELRNTHRDFGKFNRPNLYYPFYVNQNGNVSLLEDEDHTFAVYPVWNDGFEGCWTWGTQKAAENIKYLTAKKIDGGWKIYRKAYAMQDGEGVKKQVKSIWEEALFYTEKGQKAVNDLFNSREKLFQSPKSPDLIKQVLLIGQTSDCDIILDFFSGSSTTAHAVMQLNAEDGGNRQFIMVQLPELCDEKSEAYKAGYKNICEIGKERIRRAGAKILAEAENANRQVKLGEEEKPLPDVGFKVFKLDTSNIKEWDSTPVPEEDYQMVLDRMNDMLDSIKNYRTDMDVVYEIMLKMGFSLTSPVEQIDCNGVKVYAVKENESEDVFGNGILLMICLDQGITTETIEEMADYAPAQVVIAENCFADVSAMRNAHYALKDREIELKLI